MIQDVTSETRSRVDLASVWRPSASPPVLYTAVGVYIKFYICRPLLHQPLPSTRGLQRVYSSTAVYRVYRYTGIQRSTVYSGIHSPSQLDLTIRLPIVLSHATALYYGPSTLVDAKTLAKGTFTPLLWITERASTSDSRELIPGAKGSQPWRTELLTKEA